MPAQSFATATLPEWGTMAISLVSMIGSAGFAIWSLVSAKLTERRTNLLDQYEYQPRLEYQFSVVHSKLQKTGHAEEFLAALIIKNRGKTIELSGISISVYGNGQFYKSFNLADPPQYLMEGESRTFSRLFTAAMLGIEYEPPVALAYAVSYKRPLTQVSEGHQGCYFGLGG